MSDKSKQVFTAGQASGATSVHPSTLRRYVIDHREHFSSGAQISSKGRRFTDKDVELILRLRDLYHHGYTVNQVKQALAEGWDAASPTRADVAAGARVAGYAQDLVNKAAQAIQKNAVDLGMMNLQIQEQNTFIAENGRRIDELTKQLNSLVNYGVQERRPVIGPLIGVVLFGMAVILASLGATVWVAVFILLGLVAWYMTFAGMWGM